MALVQASRIRSKYLQATSKAKALQDLAMNDGGWGWCRNEGNIGRPDQAVEALRTYIQENALGMLLQENPAGLKRSVGAEHLLSQVRRFIASAQAIEDVDKVHSELVRMHKARSAK